VVRARGEYDIMHMPGGSEQNFPSRLRRKLLILSLHTAA